MESLRERLSDQIPLGPVGPYGATACYPVASTAVPINPNAPRITDRVENPTTGLGVSLSTPAQPKYDRLYFQRGRTRSSRVLSVVNRKGGGGQDDHRFQPGRDPGAGVSSLRGL